MIDWTYKAMVTKIVDGDTIDVSVDLGFKVYTVQRLRFARINAYEMRGPDRELGKKAKARVEELCPVGSEVYITTSKSGKYGRYIAEINIVSDEGTGFNLNDLLVAEGHAVVYQ